MMQDSNNDDPAAALQVLPTPPPPFTRAHPPSYFYPTLPYRILTA